jgi:hypothetical protein
VVPSFRELNGKKIAPCFGDGVVSLQTANELAMMNGEDDKDGLLEDEDNMLIQADDLHVSQFDAGFGWGNTGEGEDLVFCAQSYTSRGFRCCSFSTLFPVRRSLRSLFDRHSPPFLASMCSIRV